MTADIPEPGPTERRIAGGLVRRLLYARRTRSPHIPAADALLPRVRFTASDGASLVGIHHPAKEARGIVVLAHPDKRLGKHWWSRAGITHWLNKNGFDAFVFDFCVYGESHGGNVYLHEHVIAAVEEAERIRPDLPVHLWGVSIGSYAALNAAPVLPRLQSLILESPYPSFRAWYATGGNRFGMAIVHALERLFPTTYMRIDAARNARLLATPNILIAAARDDRITPAHLTRTIVDAAPKRARYLECPDVAHLSLFRESQAYRDAVLDTLTAPTKRQRQDPPQRPEPASLTTSGLSPLSPLTI